MKSGKADLIFRLNAKERYLTPRDTDTVTDLATIPVGQLVIPSGVPNFEAHDFELLRLNLQARAKREKQAVLFVSSSGGEGTSTTACSLALVCAANSQRQVLAVDANLTAPKLHEYFRVSQEAVTTAIMPNLRVMPTRKIDDRSASLVHMHKLSDLVSAIRGRWDWVIVDGGAINSTPHALALLNAVDGIVLVVEGGKTHRRAAQEAKKVIESAGGKLMGVVLNKRKQYLPNFLDKRL